eukprot:scaffold190503_cov26-Tisochrysis_lutea.AAC.4
MERACWRQSARRSAPPLLPRRPPLARRSPPLPCPARTRPTRPCARRLERPWRRPRWQRRRCQAPCADRAPPRAAPCECSRTFSTRRTCAAGGE